MSTLNHRNKYLLINGYIREEQPTDTDIPEDLILLILSLYPKINFKFGWHDESIFTVSENEMSMKAIDDKRCEGYLIYADLEKYNDTGLSSGIHSWSIK